MEWFKAGFVTGVLGDAGLQLLKPKGLESYFRLQGPFLSLLKAGLLTGFWSAVFGSLPSPSPTEFVILSGAVDLLYRRCYPILYPSLKDYYASYGILQTILNNMGVGLLVWNFRKFF